MDKKANLKVWLVMAVLLLGLVGNASATLVGRWTFDDGTANDSSGNGHHGTLTYGDASTNISFVYDADRGSNVLELNNPAGHTTNSVVDCGGAGDWADIRTRISITAWIKVDTFHIGNQYLLTKGSTYQLTRNSSTDRMRSYMGGLSDTILSSGAIVNDENWHHVAVTYDSDSSERIIYIDGEYSGSDTPSGLLNVHADTFVIGGRLNGSYDHRGWDGWIDDVRIYDRALSQCEIRGVAGLPPPLIIYIDSNATGANNGTSWEDAFNYLQDALAVAIYCDEIWVAGGVYEPDESFRYPNGTGSCNATFQLKNDVVIKGGYAGFGEPDPDARDIELYETILSGDLNGDDGPDFANNGENSYHVVTGNGTNATAVLDGFTITAGNAGFGGGGGMFSYEGSPTLTNCTFSGNSAEVGGGMLSWNNSNPTLTNCTFSGNSAGWIGGGMVNWDYSSPTLTGCTFNENSASESGGGMLNVEYSSPALTNCTFSGNLAGWEGGGMCNYGSNPTLTNCIFSGNSAGVVGGGISNINSSPMLTNCTFSGNSAGEHGGGVFNHESSTTLTDCTFIGNSVGEAGGGLNNSFSNSTVTNCIFTGNSAEHGGGMLIHESSPTLTNCTFSGNWAGGGGGGLNNSSHSSPTLTNCTFSANSAGGGGGMSNWKSSSMLTNCTFTDNSAENGGGMINHESSPTVTNCTFSGNSAKYAGGGMNNFGESGLTVTNCILWGNTAASGSQIYNDGASSTTVSYSDVQGGWAGAGNINADPCFVGPKFGEPPEDAIAHWRFDEGGGTAAYDSAGDNHGTLINNPTWTTGQIGGALSFDGGNDYVEVPDSASLDITDQITLEAWVLIRDVTSEWDRIVVKTFVGDVAPWNVYGIHRVGNSRKLQFDISTGANVHNPIQSDTDVLVLNEWTHVAGTFDGSTLSLFVNGGLIKSIDAAYPGYITTNNIPLSIGANNVGKREYFNGKIDDVRIYNRALSAEEIRQFYRMDYHLLPDSPCIDAGDNTAVPGGVMTDIDGAPRFVDDPYTVDTGNGTPPIVDMGAYEYRPPIYVDEDAPGPIHDGSGWADAFNHLQDALAVAISGDEIRVAEGTYTPDSNSDIPAGTGEREATFGLVNGVAIKGGYAGYGEPDPNERDVELYETVLSGDLNGDDGPDFANNGDNSYHVVTGSGINATAALDGFTITAGNANGSSWPADTGGGMYNEDGSPTLMNCTFTGNSAGWAGGGMGNSQSSPTITNCTFTGNLAEHGGGMCNETDCSPTLTNCTFSENSTGTWGGGMHNYSNSSPALTNCTFSDNLAGRGGGGMNNEQYCSPTLTNCIFSGNSSDEGGGMRNWEHSSPTLTNCTFSGNSAVQGGGMCTAYAYHSSPTLTNCTFSGNSSDVVGGGMANFESSPMLNNCILWGNEAPNWPEIYGSASVSYSCVQGSWPGTGNKNADPLFVGPGVGDLRLLPDSPCIDTGDNTAVPAGITTDLDGNPRIRGPVVDMGAFESPAVLFVDVDAAGANDGSSWQDAYNYLQDALSTEWWVDEIRVAEGIYKPDEDTAHPDGSGNREATFQLKSGVAIYGGYAGFGEPDPDERDPSTYETILSGDLNGDDGPDFANNDENSYHVVTGSGINTTAVLDGFTITAGNAGSGVGGGMYNYSGSPTLTNCAFNGNSAYHGGGTYNNQSSPTLTNCTFSGNSAGRDGGGMNNSNGSSPTLTNCTFSGNSAVGNDGGGMNNSHSSPTITNCTFNGNSAYDWGGAIRNVHSSSPTITNCTFSGNSAGGSGGGMLNYGNSSPTVTNCTFSGNSANHYGGGMRNRGGSIPTVTNCTFSGNSAPGYSGGGMSNWGGGQTVTNCTFSGNSSNQGGGMYNNEGSPTLLTNCTFSGNSASGSGGGMGNYRNNPKVTNCTFTGNSANKGGGMSNRSNSSLTVSNCILWGNTAPSGPQIYNDGTSSASVSYTDVQGSWAGAGNINADPRFLDVSGGDLRLLPTSPCIDAGDNTAVPAGVTTDLGGNLRFVDQPEVPDTGNGTAPIVDMGAFEADYIQAQMKFTPKVLNPKSKAKWIKAHLVLPEGFAVGDVNTNSPAKIVEPFIADSNYMEVFLNEDGLVEILAAFDRADFCSNGSTQGDIVVIAQLTTGQYFYGTDTIRILVNNLEYLAVLTSHWLEAGCGKPDWCSGADLDEDTVVNFVDFALFDGCCIEVIEE